MKLTIKQPGLFLTLTGLKPFRTPVVVDISKINLNTLRMELKQYGITNYEITEEPFLKIELPRRKPQKNPLSEKVNEIYKMMQELLGREQPTVEHHYHSAVETLDRLVEEKFDGEPDVEEFIPGIDISDLSDIELEYRTEEGEDITDAADKLRKLKGGDT
jgi:hypothetical protein